MSKFVWSPRKGDLWMFNAGTSEGAGGRKYSCCILLYPLRLGRSTNHWAALFGFHNGKIERHTIGLGEVIEWYRYPREDWRICSRAGKILVKG